MDNRFEHLDWALVSAFLAVAEEGSLSGAARRLDASQPTVGRQIKTLEKALNVSLFARQARGLALSETGEAMLPAARAMAEAANAIRLAAVAQEKEVTGTVRITASINVAHSLLPDVIAAVRRRYPAVQLDLVPSDDSENLLYGESDIAVRMYRPTQMDLVTRYLGTFDIALYAARSYLDRTGRPTRVEDIFDLDLVGYDTDRRLLDGMAERGYEVTRAAFATRCDEPLTQWQLIVAGCGIGFAPRKEGDADPRVEEIPLPFDVPGLPMWLTTSQAMRHTPRIRAVWEVMVERLGTSASA
ncbi:MAG: LysR family transcriptional regulator [Pseudomonadota bacterium]